MFIVVDLPEPDGPMTATKSPRAIARSTPFSAWNAAAPVPKVLVIPSSSMIGASVTRLSAVPHCGPAAPHCGPAAMPVTTFMPRFNSSDATTVKRPSLCPVTTSIPRREPSLSTT